MSDYEVGYKKPLKTGQFPKGKSGNSSGRPKNEKRPKTFQDTMEDIFYTKRKVLINGEEKIMTGVDIIILKLNEFALKGDIQAAKLLIPLLLRFGIDIECDYRYGKEW